MEPTHILFLGDSITDCGRNATAGSTISIGQSYCMLLDADLSYRFPGQYTFTNMGISGNRIVDVYARIKKDCWNLSPDVISLLLGINDVWHELGETHNGVDAERFYNVYRMLIQDTRKRLPDVKLILMEPFVLKASATEEQWDVFYTETRLRAEAVRRLAQEFNLLFVPLQDDFDKALALQPASYWAKDGVHPTPAGHALIAKAWLKVFEG